MVRDAGVPLAFASFAVRTALALKMKLRRVTSLIGIAPFLMPKNNELLVQTRIRKAQTRLPSEIA
jgi:hypothetical protein